VFPFTLVGLAESLSLLGIFFLALGAVLALMIATWLMLLFNANHPPACATTLIISLGILPDLLDGFFIIAAVAVMYAVYQIVQSVILKRSGLPISNDS
jgi:CBS-domain-containing membrane protein